MRNVREFNDPTSILLAIQKKYPRATEKVTSEFAEAIIRNVDTLVRANFVGEESRAQYRHRLLNFYQAAVRGKMTAKAFHDGVNSLLRLQNEQSPDSAVERLQRQLAELRVMVADKPSDIDGKFKMLQDQIATIQRGMVDDGVLILEKQEDMLQKFLSAQKRAFIIMPFAREFDNVWFGGIKPACLEGHYAPLRVDEVNLSSLITEDIERYSGMAGVVVVDLTGNNPNVMFELGWSLAKNKRPIVICQGDHSSKVAFDVRGIRHITYENTWLGIEALKKKLKEFIAATDRQSSPKKTKKTVLVPTGTQSS
jgi:hypothetical protein